MIDRFFKPKSPDLFLDKLNKEIFHFSTTEQPNYYQGISEIVYMYINDWVNENKLHLAPPGTITYIPVSSPLYNFNSELIQFQLPVAVKSFDYKPSWIEKIIGIKPYFHPEIFRLELWSTFGVDWRLLRGFKNPNRSTLERLNLKTPHKQVVLKEVLNKDSYYKSYIGLKVTNRVGSKARLLKVPSEIKGVNQPCL